MIINQPQRDFSVVMKWPKMAVERCMNTTKGEFAHILPQKDHFICKNMTLLISKKGTILISYLETASSQLNNVKWILQHVHDFCFHNSMFPWSTYVLTPSGMLCWGSVTYLHSLEKFSAIFNGSAFLGQSLLCMGFALMSHWAWSMKQWWGVTLVCEGWSLEAWESDI